MSADTLIRKCHELACIDPETEAEPDSLIGFFQTFRPDGNALAELYEDLEVGDALQSRLQQLFAAAGDDRRPSGGRDAYFVVRSPQPLDPVRAKELTEQWLEGIHAIATQIGDSVTCDLLTPMPSVRVLEGTPPKHPKNESEQSSLLKSIRSTANFAERLDAGPYAVAMRPAYYFTACDAMLRDYLMWPLYADVIGLKDPLAAYFDLWRHGAKYRIFGESQVDLYLPRHFEQPTRLESS